MTTTEERVLFPTGAAELVLPDGVDREHWLAARRTGFGGSDIAGLLGMSRWSSPYQVWLDKTGRAAEEPDTWAMFRGREDETKLRRWFTRETGITVETTGMWRSLAHPLAFANPDGLTSDGGLIECKSHSWRMGEEWDEDQVSDGAELQTQWYLGVLDLPHAWVIAQIGDDEPVIRRVERDRLLFAHLAKTADRFWRDHIANDNPPAFTSPSDLDAVKAQHPRAETETAVADPADVAPVIARIREAKARAKAAQADADIAEAELVALIGDATDLTAGGRVVARRPEVHTTRLDGRRLRADHPDLADEYTTTSTYRRLTIPKEK